MYFSRDHHSSAGCANNALVKVTERNEIVWCIQVRDATKSVHHPVQTMLVAKRTARSICINPSHLYTHSRKGIWEKTISLKSRPILHVPFMKRIVLLNFVSRNRPTFATKLTNFYSHQECNRLVYIRKMCYLLLLLLLPVVTSELCEYPWYQYDTCQNNSLSCPSDQKCAFIEYCPAVVSLMDRNALSAHR